MTMFINKLGEIKPVHKEGKILTTCAALNIGKLFVIITRTNVKLLFKLLFTYNIFVHAYHLYVTKPECLEC
jgi:hypothetical protein